MTIHQLVSNLSVIHGRSYSELESLLSELEAADLSALSVEEREQVGDLMSMIEDKLLRQ